MFTDFNKLKKNLKKEQQGLKTVTIAILADTATQFMAQAIKGYGIEANIDFDIYEADYDQTDQEVFNYASGLYQFKPAFVLINFSTEHLLKKFYKAGNQERLQFAEQEINYIHSIFQSIQKNSSSKLLLNTFIEINDAVFGNYAAKEKTSFVYQLRKLNLLLMELSQQHADLFIYDLFSQQAQVGYTNIFDPKMYINADMVYSIDFLPHLAKCVTDVISAVTGNFKKALIVDLDNTIWGGIIGDDGMEGIQIGNLGIGKAFSEFQLWLKELKERGIIIAVCSKNTEEIAKEPFLQHPDMILQMNDISLFVANWENKADNIRHIQSVLNIGFDSMVFIDDNPFEREMVKSAIPEITVPDMPEDPAEYLLHLRSLNLFETASFTEEDKLRTSQYQQEGKRAILQNSFASEDEFLEKLEMRSEVKPFDKFSSPRVAQLTQRSNQFNLRTVRYTEQEILKLSSSDNYYTLSMTLEDKFGKYGLIGAVILKRMDDARLFIDTWIMSCRVLKRGMENFTLNCIVELAKKNNYSTIVGEYLPTKKNIIVRDHYAGLGFAKCEDEWLLEVSQYTNGNTHIKKSSEQ